MSNRFERRGDVAELKLAWKRQKIAESVDKWRKGRWQDAIIEYECTCDKPFEECVCE